MKGRLVFLSIKLLQTIFDQDFRLPEIEENYQTMIKDIEFFHISSQVYMLLNQNRKLESTPTYFRDFLTQRFKDTLYINMMIKHQLEILFGVFEEKQIEMIPLKGVIFAEKAFSHLGARATSDIDILVKQSELSKVLELIKKEGFELVEEQDPSHFHCSFRKKVSGLYFPLTVEIHWGILKENTSSLKISEFWAESIPLEDYKYVKQLSQHHTFYMICLHGWRHNLDSLKYFIDIIQLIYLWSDKIDYHRLFNEAAKHKTLKRLRRTLSIVYKEYPTLSEVLPLPKKYSIVFWDYKAFRNPDHKSLKKYFDFFDYQFLSYDSVSHSLVEIIHWILPSRVYRS
jgi:hypothetical protein